MFYKQQASNWVLLATPGIDLTNATMLIYDYQRYSSIPGMKIKLGVMTNPNDTLTFTMLDVINVENSTWLTDTVFLSGLTGVQYLAFNIMGPPPYTLLLIDNVIVAGDQVSANWPSYVTNLTAMAAPGGANYANVSWINPSTEADGDPLTDLDSVVVLANNEWSFKLINPVIGQPVSVEAPVPEAGFYNFTVTAYNTAGASSPITSDTVWVGLDTPGPVHGLVMTVVNDSTSSLAWTAPTEGAHGAYYNNIVGSYKVIRADGTEFTVDGNTYTFGETFTTPGTYNYTVIAVNNSGYGTPAASNAGAFYFQGYLLWEDFWVDVPAFGWTEAGDGTEREWFSGVGGFAGATPPEAYFWPRYWLPFTGTHRMISPVLSTAGQTALSLDFQYFPEVDLGPFTTKVETTSDGGNTWNTVWVSEVTQTLDPANINILIKNDDIGSTDFQFAYTFEGYNLNAFAVFIDALRLYPSVGVDVAPLSLTIPDYIRPGDQVTPSAVIKSYGSIDTTVTAVLTFYNGTDTVYKSVVSKAIIAGSADTISFQQWNAVEGGYDAMIRAICPGDERPSNDILTRNFGVYNPFGSRTLVVCEDFTGTWCAYCPGAAMGLDELVENSWPVAVISYHMSDPYETTEGRRRNDYYLVSGYPTVHFDGIQAFLGGSSTQSMYTEYIPMVENRLAINADASIVVQDLNVVDSILTGNVVMESASSITNPNLVLHVVVTESHMPVSWQNQDEINFTERSMFGDAEGTPVDLSDKAETIPVAIHLSAAWNRPTLELVVFLQDTLTKEVLNGNKVSLDHVGLSEPGIHATICPNPAPGWFMINCDERIDKVSVFDVTGRCVMKQEPGIFNPIVRFGGLKSGLYVARIKTSSGEITRKLLVE
jgi:thiol-disulfide isomerase/thioredoxin